MVETMMADDKILKSLKSTIAYLENSMQALNKKDDSLFADSIWHVAAELEYTLFLHSIKFQNEINPLKWKPNPEFKKADSGSTLVEVRNLLNEAIKCILNEKLLDAYKNAYIARYYVLKVQEDLARKKHEALKKK
jgi:hypothetical protein